MIGSYNFDMRSTYIDTETMLVIRGKAFNETVRKQMEKIGEESLLRKPDGSYEAREGVQEKKLEKGTDLFYRAASWVLQPFRYLI